MQSTNKLSDLLHTDANVRELMLATLTSAVAYLVLQTADRLTGQK